MLVTRQQSSVSVCVRVCVCVSCAFWCNNHYCFCWTDYLTWNSYANKPHLFQCLPRAVSHFVSLQVNIFSLVAQLQTTVRMRLDTRDGFVVQPNSCVTPSMHSVHVSRFSCLLFQMSSFFRYFFLFPFKICFNHVRCVFQKAMVEKVNSMWNWWMLVFLFRVNSFASQIYRWNFCAHIVAVSDVRDACCSVLPLPQLVCVCVVCEGCGWRLSQHRLRFTVLRFRSVPRWNTWHLRLSGADDVFCSARSVVAKSI